MRNLDFSPENYYHIYNRGVDKREIFITEDDRIRFLIGLLAYNSTRKHLVSKWYNALEHSKDPVESIKNDIINPLVKISAFCLMPNHFHLVLNPIKEDGVSSFMHRLDCGYTNYFNSKYERTGSLFEGPFKAKWISDEKYFQQIIRYIHLNPLDVKSKEWRKTGIKNNRELSAFLKSYQWSSLPYYLGQSSIKIIDFVLDAKMVNNYFANSREHLRSLELWSEDDYEELESIRFEGVKNKNSSKGYII